MNCLIYLRVSTKEQVEKGENPEGLSIPAQREACIKYIQEKGWNLIDEYVDRGESARSAHRPQLQEMLSFIKKDKSINAVVVHKIDRLARNMEDHVAIKAILRRQDVGLVSVVENIEDTASGRLVEGIHALMAEFYSANLSMETKKGMRQKIKQGGWPGPAPIGYLNETEVINGRVFSKVMPDPERAPFIKLAFKLYATGQYSLASLRDTLTKKGLRTKPSRKWSSRPISRANLNNVLKNSFFMGIMDWNGAKYKGTYEPLVDKELFERVRQVLKIQNLAGERKRVHHHFLKGTIFCGECGSRLSVDTAKGHVYFYCLGKKRKIKCSQRYFRADSVEQEIEKLYKRIQLAPEWVEKLKAKFEQELIENQQTKIDEQKLAAKRINRLVEERQKLMQAHYAGAIPMALLKEEQNRISRELEQAEKQMTTINASEDYIKKWINRAIEMCGTSGLAYKSGDELAKRLFNQAIFEKIYIKEGKISRVDYSVVFNVLFKPADSIRAGSSIDDLAPRVRLELTTLRLQLPPNFFEDWTISSPKTSRGAGCRALPLRLWRRVLPFGIVSAPSLDKFEGLAQDCLLPFRQSGFPEFTRFFNHSYLWKLQLFTAECSTIELPRNQCMQFRYIQANIITLKNLVIKFTQIIPKIK